jgi:hypothetical protein
MLTQQLQEPITEAAQENKKKEQKTIKRQKQN